VFWFLACDPEPAAGELRTDLAQLSERMVLPPDVRGARWTIEAAHVGRSGAGRADAFVYAWLEVPANSDEWLTDTLGAPLGTRVHWVPDRLALHLFSDEERALLQHDDGKGNYKLACERWMGGGLGRGEYKGQVVMLCGDRLFVGLAAK
jgi:hypothetical protein